VAREMERRGLSLPLLIGGATTSRQHTAVKIAPEYGAITTYVPDASRVTDVVSSLLNSSARPAFEQATRDEQEAVRQRHQAARRAPLRDYPAALANRLALKWSVEPPAVPCFLGRREIADQPLDALRPYIDWTFFFSAWQVKGRFPAVLDHPQHGAAARELYAHAQELLDDIVAHGGLKARGVYGFWPAESDGEDILLFEDASRTRAAARFPMLRQQEIVEEGRPSRSLADFVAPAGGRGDYLGAFAVTAGIGAQELVRQYEADHDDYRAIMVKALADRLAEAFAEFLHAQARRDWGYGRQERLGQDDLISERYRGIRPAFGYPACPDHSEKRTLFALLDPAPLGLTLTDTCAMSPAASVSGLYFAHPDAHYFSVGRIGRDQVESYARRKGLTVEEVERWLGQNLAYESRSR